MVPVGRVGLYVPGGLAPLASSVIMNVVPAQVAGVASIALASPPQREFGGLPHPNILALCHLLGVTEVYAVGGAQAIAMFAYGVPELCAPVDLVTGPGNIYVVAAKRLLKGRVNIDSEAGPTEIAVLADAHRRPGARGRRPDLPGRARPAGRRGAGHRLDRAGRAGAGRAGRPGARRPSTPTGSARRWPAGSPPSCWSTTWSRASTVVNAYAAEHLEIQTADAEPVAGRISNAGAIFVGPWSPVSLGDYCAGSTHVLPTGGCACHSSGLNVKSFLKAVHVIDYSRGRWPRSRGAVEVFAEAEDLPAHGAAVTRAVPLMTSGAPRRWPTCRCGPSWSARCRTARRSSTSRSASTSTRTPTRRASAWWPRSPRRRRSRPGR